MKSKTNNGFALVLVLMLVVLMTIMVLAIFSRVGTESKASSASSSGQMSRQLADLAVQVVKSQIQKATTQGTGVAWASQPGMIRCYDRDGNETQWFKLYSSDNMTVGGGKLSGGNLLSLMESDLPAGKWQGKDDTDYGIFTDLNSPVYAADGATLSYPIVDPSGAKSLASSGTNVIAGFDVSVSEVPGYMSGGSFSATNNPTAMPVRWLYVLEDGSLVPGVASGTPGEVRVQGAGNNNRIIGRVAFWTDDETCKLNINTAADGTYFDSPRFNSIAPRTSGTIPDTQRFADRQFAVAPPVAREFQRYIGHPAQTRLSVVLPGLQNLDSQAKRSEIATCFSPFLQSGGSEGGARGYSTQVAGGYILDKNEDDPLKPPKRPTLYASLDEWLFATTMSGYNRDENTKSETGTPLVTNQDLQRLHFFLTAASDAPEVNLFGHPRIAMWPISNYYLTQGNTTPYTTPLDRMIAAAASLGAGNSRMTYFFTHQDSTSQTFDYSGIPRNQALFNYLRKLSETNIPGYGNNFVAKYEKAEADQILTEIFDYIRSTNLTDMSLSSDYYYTQGILELRQPDYNENKKWALGRGQVTPIIIDFDNYKTKGFGRFPTIKEVAVDFFCTGTNPWTMRPIVYLDIFTPSLGPADLLPCYLVTIDGLNSLSVTVSGSTCKLFGDKPSSTVVVGRGGAYSTRPYAPRWHAGTSFPFNWGGIAGPRPLLVYKGVNNAFLGPEIPYNSSNDTMTFLGSSSDLTVRIYYADMATFRWTPGQNSDGLPVTGTNFLVQQIKVKFPQTAGISVPTPSPGTGTTAASMLNRVNYPTENESTANKINNPIQENDVVRSVTVGSKYNGDIRLVAGQYEVPGDGFEPMPEYHDTTRSAHSMRDLFYTQGMNFNCPAGFVSSHGKLVQNASYSSAYYPVTGIISDANSPEAGSPDATGDWDNGLSIFPDGPYINKPDEIGMQYFDYGGNYTYYGQGDGGIERTARTYSSPNRTVASPVMFGSLSTGIPINGIAPAPWRTLLFRPQQNHFGQTTAPKDSLILDWFWMPVVDPYAISTCMSTAGKVNLNYQLAPFTYITRATALIGVLGSEYVIAVPTSAAGVYKNRSSAATNYRFPVRVLEDDNLTAAEKDGTLRQFKERFDQGKAFRSASDICDIYLVPGAAGGVAAKAWTSDADAEAFWRDNKLSGDNTRERPYNGLYSRLTTKSNTYTVHVRAQALKMPADTPANTWRERPQYIQSEYRGSTIINRYLDPEDGNIPDFANNANFSKSLDNYYKYRVLESRRFLP